MIEVKNMVAGYGPKVLIRNLFFEVTQPSFVALIGHNGCGKTTFFRALTGSLQYSGKILVDGKDLSQIQNPAGNGVYAYLPQKNPISFPISVSELVVMGKFRQKKFFENYSLNDYKQVSTILGDLGISHLEDREFTELSGGEQQMVLLCQLMLQDANICLLDEPTQSLDVYFKKRVFNLLSSWVKEHNKTVLCITHDLANLYDMEGYLLNFSKAEPELEKISPESIRENQLFLEEPPIYYY